MFSRKLEPQPSTLPTGTRVDTEARGFPYIDPFDGLEPFIPGNPDVTTAPCTIESRTLGEGATQMLTAFVEAQVSARRMRPLSSRSIDERLTRLGIHSRRRSAVGADERSLIRTSTFVDMPL